MVEEDQLLSPLLNKIIYLVNVLHHIPSLPLIGTAFHTTMHQKMTISFATNAKGKATTDCCTLRMIKQVHAFQNVYLKL
jgi:hypothetical protein